MKLPYGLKRRMKRGVRLTIGLTFKCNFKCSYCMLLYINGKMPQCKKELTAIEWHNLIQKFPLLISELSFTGGEILLYQNLPELLNLLPDIPVTLYSNLSIKHPNLSDILLKRKYTKLDATYHDQYSRKKFEDNLKYYRQFCTVNENRFTGKQSRIGIGKNRCYDKVIIERDQELKCMDDKRFLYTPDGTLCTSLREYIERNLYD